ncbi:MAG: hypothetical protein JOZ86_00365 [Candidatus Eremiobacteraeota bacterium]|nr:hypothetical protein [Candidatus Eremiobacteraeota bacterium]
MRALLRFTAATVLAIAAVVRPAAAHPLGNFTVNHLSRITAERGRVEVRYVLDLAEIPSFTLDRALDRRGAPSQPTLEHWAAAHAATIAPELRLTIDGRPTPLSPLRSTVRRRPGAAGLPTLYVTATYAARIEPGAHRLTYRDETEPGRLGWTDVVVGAAREPTDELRTYPSALTGSPRTRIAVAADVYADGRIGERVDAPPFDKLRMTGGAVAASAGLTRTSALADLLARGSGDPLAVLGALLLAIALGALHALEPGHGKTLLAVSLVGARATARQAFVLAGALTVAHTAGVLAFGVVVLAAARWIVPEQLYPWLTLAAGVVVAALGARALARQVHARLPHALGDHHTHAHSHDDLDDEAHARAHAIPGTAPLTFGSAVVAAASGNVAPCPAALVVLLAAVALHRVGYGLALIVAFSLGLAAVLTVIGVAVVRSAAWLVARPRFDRVARLAPLVTAVVIAVAGAAMVARGLAAQADGVPVPVIGALVLVAVAGYALTGHRHTSHAHGHHAHGAHEHAHSPHAEVAA